MIVPISDRARKYGYLFWPKVADADMRALLADAPSVEVLFDGQDLGTKKVDWKNRRISVGPLRTRTMSESAETFSLAYAVPKLTITVR